jgi:hypothetical protein
MRWSWRRRARARKTLAWVVRHVGVCVFGMSDFISRGAVVTAATWAAACELLRRGFKSFLALKLRLSECGSVSRCGSKNLPFGNPAESKLLRAPTPVGFAAQARAWCAFIG